MKECFDTVAAISTPPGAGGISIIRISGASAFSIISRIFINKSGVFPAVLPGRFRYGFVVNPLTTERLDECIVLFMKSPRSYTGEDVVEIQVHGGVISPSRVLEAAISAGARPAEPGEFTLRAFLNGKKDLVAAEAVEQLIQARTVTQADNAGRQLLGKLTERLNPHIAALREAVVALEAEINFPDDVERRAPDNLNTVLREYRHAIKELLRSHEEGKPFAEGLYAVITGKPNVGKSSFLNSVLNYDRAIVNPAPGTTRDYLEETVVFEGVLLKIVDTAGIRNAADQIERQGIDRALSLLPRAAVIFGIFDGSRPADNDDIELIALMEKQHNACVFALLNKMDKGSLFDAKLFPAGFNVMACSCKTGENMDRFKALFRQSVRSLWGRSDATDIFPTSARHVSLLSAARTIIDEYLENPGDSDTALFAITDLLRLHDRLIGRQSDPAEIDAIFSRFCIGK